MAGMVASLGRVDQIGKVPKPISSHATTCKAGAGRRSYHADLPRIFNCQ